MDADILSPSIKHIFKVHNDRTKRLHPIQGSPTPAQILYAGSH